MDKLLTTNTMDAKKVSMKRRRCSTTCGLVVRSSYHAALQASG